MFVYFCGTGSLTYGFLEDGFVKVVALDDAGTRVFGQIEGGKEKLPNPFFISVGGFFCNCAGQVDGTKAILEVFLVK